MNRKSKKYYYFKILAVTPMVQDAKCVAIDPLDHNAVSRWRESNRAVSSENVADFFDVGLRLGGQHGEK